MYESFFNYALVRKYRHAVFRSQLRDDSGTVSTATSRSAVYYCTLFYPVVVQNLVGGLLGLVNKMCRISPLIANAFAQRTPICRFSDPRRRRKTRSSSLPSSALQSGPLPWNRDLLDCSVSY